MRCVDVEGVGGILVKLILVSLIIVGDVGAAIADDGVYQASPLFAYRHEKAVASMSQEQVEESRLEWGEVPNAAPSGTPGSWCLYSGCFGSVCLISGCLASYCIGVSGCDQSRCIGSLCMGTWCMVSACANETSCLRICHSPGAPIDFEPVTWTDCTYGACRLNP